MILQQLLESDGDLILSTDQNWEKSYEIRTEVSQKFSDFIKLKNNQIIKFFKNSEEIIDGDCVVEFIGLMKLSKMGSEKMVRSMMIWYYHYLLKFGFNILNLDKNF